MPYYIIDMNMFSGIASEAIASGASGSVETVLPQQ